MKRKLAVICMMVFFINIFSIGLAWAETETEPEGEVIYKTKGTPLWSIDSIEQIGDALIGDSFTIKMVVRNMGNGGGVFPIVEFKEDDKDELVNFEVDGGGSVYDPAIEVVDSGESKVFNITMNVSENTREVPGDGYKLTAIVKSYGWNISVGDRSYKTTKAIYVSPQYSMTEPQFSVKKVTFNPEVTGGVSETKATFEIENISDAKARNVTVSLAGTKIGTTEDKNIKIKDLSNLKTVGDIAGGKTFTVTYDLELDSARQNNEMIMTVDYAGADKAQEETINLPLPLDNSNGKTPRVIINKYTLSPSKVYAGNRASLLLYVENTNAKAVTNVQISLRVPENESSSSSDVISSGTVFSPVDSSNTFFIERIEGKSVAVKTIELHVDANAAAKTYVVPVNIEYEGLDGTEYHSEDNINIPVGQESGIDIISEMVDTMGNVNAPLNYNVEFVNSGKVALQNLKVYLENEEDPAFKEAVYYIGTLEAGDTESFSGAVFPTIEGTANMNLVFSYTADGENVTIAYPYTAQIDSEIIEEPIDPGMMEPMEEGNPFFQQLRSHLLTIVLVLIILVLLFIIWRGKRKSKAEEELLNG